MKFSLLTCSFTLALAAAGCASSGPSSELVDARRAYDEARSSTAATYAPDKLLSAKQALERAEAAHADHPGSFQEQSLAYVAQRRATLAQVYGSYEKDRRDESAADAAYRQRQDDLRKSAEQRATDATNSLQSTFVNLNTARRELASQQTQLQNSQQQLDQEKKARENAEQSAAAALASLNKIAQVKEESRGTVITLEGAVLFVTGKSELLPIARDKLNTVAKALKDLDDDKVAQVEGYTDSRGADDMNLKLSQDRANAVREYLVSQGVKPERIRALGRGEERPVASNDTPEGRANNRRVEIVIQSQNQTQVGAR